MLYNHMHNFVTLVLCGLESKQVLRKRAMRELCSPRTKDWSTRRMVLLCWQHSLIISQLTAFLIDWQGPGNSLGWAGDAPAC